MLKYDSKKNNNKKKLNKIKNSKRRNKKKTKLKITKKKKKLIPHSPRNQYNKFNMLPELLKSIVRVISLVLFWIGLFIARIIVEIKTTINKS